MYIPAAIILIFIVAIALFQIKKKNEKDKSDLQIKKLEAEILQKKEAEMRSEELRIKHLIYNYMDLLDKTFEDCEKIYNNFLSEFQIEYSTKNSLLTAIKKNRLYKQLQSLLDELQKEELTIAYYPYDYIEFLKSHTCELSKFLKLSKLQQVDILNTKSYEEERQEKIAMEEWHKEMELEEKRLELQLRFYENLVETLTCFAENSKTEDAESDKSEPPKYDENIRYSLPKVT